MTKPTKTQPHRNVPPEQHITKPCLPYHTKTRHTAPNAAKLYLPCLNRNVPYLIATQPNGTCHACRALTYLA